MTSFLLLFVVLFFLYFELAPKSTSYSRLLTFFHHQCHNRDRTYPYRPYPDLSTPIPSHLNHSRAPNAKPEPSDPLTSQQRTPEHSDSLASSQRVPDLTLIRPLLFLASSRFPTTTLIPDLTPFDLHSFASNLFPMFHWSRDCSWVKPNRVPPSLDAS